MLKLPCLFRSCELQALLKQKCHITLALNLNLSCTWRAIYKKEIYMGGGEGGVMHQARSTHWKYCHAKITLVDGNSLQYECWDVQLMSKHFHWNYRMLDQVSMICIPPPIGSPWWHNFQMSHKLPMRNIGNHLTVFLPCIEVVNRESFHSISEAKTPSCALPTPEARAQKHAVISSLLVWYPQVMVSGT